MLNEVVLIGRLTRDVEIKTITSGKKVANFTLAVDRPFTNQQGEREADFITIIVWEKQAENCEKYIKKGSLVAVTGRLQIRSYEDGEGIKRKVAEVVADNVRFLDSKPKNTGTAQDMIDTATEIDTDEVPF